jgi:thiamine transport system substrate-binding protein
MKKIVAITLSMLMFAACSGNSDESSSSSNGPVTLTLLAHDSFTPSEGIFDAFTAETGITVNVVRSGDAGELISKAALTAGNPEGDVLWGVDNTLLSRALDADMFDSYQSPNLAFMNESLMRNIPGHEVTPVDTGDVCINYDIAWFTDNNIAPPMSLEALISSTYANLLVVPSAVTSSPGLAFFLATVAEFGEEGWQDYWKSLRENGVLVVDGWTQAYSTEFSGSSGKGERPIVVSYSSSPAAEVLFADPPTDVAPTGVAPLTCFEQIEYAGILRGTKHKFEAQQLIDYLTSTTFQSDLPLTQFVFPVHADATIPESFTRYISRPERALSIEYNVIAENRAAWLDEWSTIVFK